MRISDWSSDVCSSDLWRVCSSCSTTWPSAFSWKGHDATMGTGGRHVGNRILLSIHDMKPIHPNASTASRQAQRAIDGACSRDAARLHGLLRRWQARSEEHTSELQSLMRISYAVFCLKKNSNT